MLLTVCRYWKAMSIQSWGSVKVLKYDRKMSAWGTLPLKRATEALCSLELDAAVFRKGNVAHQAIRE